MTDALTLDDLLIRASSHTPFFGIYLATHAIADGLCMCHASVGCKVKTELHLCDHDGVRDAHNRRRYSQFIDEDLIQGSTAQLEEEIQAWQKRLQARVVVIDGSTPISLQGQSMAPVIERMEAACGVDVVHVPARNYDDDLWAGYVQTATALLARQFQRQSSETKAELHDDEVTVLGYPFDRYEADHTATVAELRRLLWALGLKAKAVFFAGEPYATLADAVHARAHLLLPWAHGQARAVRKLGAEAVPVGLPMSLGGTRKFMEEVGNRLQVPARRVAAVVEHELERIKPQAELARRLLRGRSFAAFADAPRLAGVTATLMELGMVPTVLGVLHLSPGKRADVERMLRDHHGIALPDGVQWLEDPAPHEIQALPPAHRPDAGAGDATLARRAAFARTDLVVGTTIERDLLDAAAVRFVEFGYPSETRHALFPAPWLGYNGFLRLAEQVTWSLERLPQRR